MRITYDAMVALGLDGFVNHHKGSEYAGSQLLAYEKKYNRSTSDFLRYYDSIIADYEMGMVSPLVAEDFKHWDFMYTMFLKANGSLQNLYRQKEEIKKDGDDINSPSSFFTNGSP